MNSQQEKNIKKAADLIKKADAILITASNGLSITEGLHLFANNKAFKDLLGDFEEKYGFHNLLQGFFYPWKTSEEKWRFLCRVINHYSGAYSGSPVMENLKKIVADKQYFVVTSNAEGHFQLSGFNEENVYEVEVSWLKMRCSKQCHNDLYPSMDVIRKLSTLEKDGKSLREDIPRCPKCGAVMDLYETNPVDENVIKNWNTFMQSIIGKHFVVLELGIGSRNQLIKGPMMQLVARENKSAYTSINLGDLFIPDLIADRSVGIDGYLHEVLQSLAEEIRGKVL